MASRIQTISGHLGGNARDAMMAKNPDDGE